MYYSNSVLSGGGGVQELLLIVRTEQRFRVSSMLPGRGVGIIRPQVPSFDRLPSNKQVCAPRQRWRLFFNAA